MTAARQTPLGRLLVAEPEALFAAAAATAIQTAGAGPLVCALTGGSTPRAWYRWCVDRRALPPEVLSRATWTVSDERHVPLGHADSNFGQAARQLLDPLGVPSAARLPWPVELPAAEAAAAYAAARSGLRAYDLCFLGLGDDAHTASLFPGSPLLADDGGRWFAAVEASGRGWRLTITPAGLRACGRIVVMVLGASKAEALARVFGGAEPVAAVPARVLAAVADRVTWLVDPPAAERLS